MAVCRATLSRITTIPLASTQTSPYRPILSSYVQIRYYAKKKKKQPLNNDLTQEEADLLEMDNLTRNMDSALESLKWEYTNKITLKLNPAMIGNLQLREDSKLKIKDVGQIIMPNPQKLSINFSSQPSYIQDAVSILRAKTNLSPTIQGHTVDTSIPRPSKELRDNLTKEAKKSADNAKVRVRRVRQTAISNLRKQKDSISKDTLARLEDAVHKISESQVSLIDELLKSKQKDIQN